MVETSDSHTWVHVGVTREGKKIYSWVSVADSDSGGVGWAPGISIFPVPLSPLHISGVFSSPFFEQCLAMPVSSGSSWLSEPGWSSFRCRTAGFGPLVFSVRRQWEQRDHLLEDEAGCSVLGLQPVLGAGQETCGSRGLRGRSWVGEWREMGESCR